MSSVTRHQGISMTQGSLSKNILLFSLSALCVVLFCHFSYS